MASTHIIIRIFGAKSYTVVRVLNSQGPHRNPSPLSSFRPLSPPSSRTPAPTIAHRGRGRGISFLLVLLPPPPPRETRNASAVVSKQAPPRGANAHIRGCRGRRFSTHHSTLSAPHAVEFHFSLVRPVRPPRSSVSPLLRPSHALVSLGSPLPRIIILMPGRLIGRSFRCRDCVFRRRLVWFRELGTCSRPSSCSLLADMDRLCSCVAVVFFFLFLCCYAIRTRRRLSGSR